MLLPQRDWEEQIGGSMKVHCSGSSCTGSSAPPPETPPLLVKLWDPPADTTCPACAARLPGDFEPDWKLQLYSSKRPNIGWLAHQRLCRTAAGMGRPHRPLAPARAGRERCLRQPRGAGRPPGAPLQASLWAALYCLVRLSAFSLVTSHLSHRCPCCSSFERLQLAGVTGLQNQQLELLLCSLPGLRDLDLAGCIPAQHKKPVSSGAE